jgi:deazaflavin-dependent oxidoreductase (nitroreductase family)
MSAIDWQALDRHWNCRLTARGRKTGKERTVTMWYALGDGKIFLAGSPDPPHWVRNVRATPDVVVQIGTTRLRGRGRVVDDEAEARSIRERLVRRYVLARLSRLFGGYTRSVPVVVEGIFALRGDAE